MRPFIRILVSISFVLLPALDAAEPHEADIAINQVGYRIKDEKDFRLARPVVGFQILDSKNAVGFDSKMVGPVSDQYAGCDVWKGVFTELKKPGTYVIQLSDGTRSWPFQIGDDVYAPLLQTALRGLYMSRCGYAVKDDAFGHRPCHLRDGAFMMVGEKQIPDGRDATGGWHNGADYQRSTMSSAQAVSRLLWPVELFPGAFDKVPSRLQPDERRGNQPDLLTEARWGLEWLFSEDFLKRFAQLPSPYPAAPINTQTIRIYNLHEALISYCFIKQNADKNVQAQILAGLRADCDRLAAISQAEGYGSVLTAENWKHRHTSGNALQMGWELAMAFELTGCSRYRETALRQLHFVLGANPLGKVLATGIGSNPVRNPHYGPFFARTEHPAPPGLLVKGPTHDAQFIEKIYRDRTPPPPEKAYIDVVTAHWCNEPDIEVQGHLIGLSAYFHSTAGASR